MNMCRIKPESELELGVCRDEAAFRSVMSLKGHNHARLVIASDDLQVHESAKVYVDLKVVYFSQIESYFSIVPHVLKVLEAVNCWLRKQGDNSDLPEDLLYWVQHVEGGITTQRIQDAILEVRTCIALFDKFHPSKLIIGAGSKSYWEDGILLSCAAQRDIPVHRLKKFDLSQVAMDIWQWLRPLAKEIYRSIQVINSILRRRSSGFRQHSFGQYVAIQLCSSAGKHLNHTLPLLKAFKNTGMKAVAVTYEIGHYAKSLRAQGYNIAELEAWVRPQALFRSWCIAFKGYHRAKANINTFLQPGNERSEYQALIRSALLPSILSFFLHEVPQRYRLYAASRIFFKHNPPVAARLWTNVLPQGVIAYRAMLSADVIPLMFLQLGWPYLMSEPYSHSGFHVNLFFCVSDIHRQMVMKEIKNNCDVVVSGIAWRPIIDEFISKNSQENSRASLGVPTTAKFVVFCDALVVMRGYTTSSEQLLLVKTVIEFAERHEDVCVLIKPHTGHKPGQLEKAFKKRGHGRVIWISGNSLPYDCINSAHLQISKASTMVAEAMLFGVPSICLLLDKELQWAYYEDAADYILDISELNNRLEELRDPCKYETWSRDLRQCQKRFMKDHLPEPLSDVNIFIAEKVLQAISNSQSQLSPLR